jgi:hypothetical protein
MDDPRRLLLLYFIIPVWFLAGFADYVCHRATDIAHTGPRESLFHLLMFAEIALPLLMCLFLEINALVFAVMIAAFLAHDATALWDVSYGSTNAMSRRGHLETGLPRRILRNVTGTVTSHPPYLGKLTHFSRLMDDTKVVALDVI